ncbi:MAG: aspartate kinase [Melioribacteraceae bacterium]|nr:aspartate kinase [Melioribacteraceae bacterium]
MIVMKFGGTSVKDAEAFKNVTGIIKSRLNKKPLVVVSALAGITNLLIESLNDAAAHNIEKINHNIDEIKNRHSELIDELIIDGEIKTHLLELLAEEIDKLITLLNAARTIKLKSGALSHAVMSIGEILSSNILNGFLQTVKVNSGIIDAREVIVIENKRGDSFPDIDAIKENAVAKLIPILNEHECVVCAGFIGSTKEGEPATLGRNGSDYTASLLCSALNGDELEIWSDVDGILTADPTIIPAASPLKVMSFNEACELAYFGARVLHPAAIQPALEKNIPVRVLNSNTPDQNGTLIIKEIRDDETNTIVKSIAYKEGITLLNIESSKLLLSPKIIEEIFLILTHHGKRVYAISKSATKLSVTIENHADDLPAILTEISEYGEVTAQKGKVIVSVVGEKMAGHPSVPWHILQKLDEHKIKTDLVSQFASQISLVFIIDESEIEKTVTLLHKEFIESN